MYPAYYTAANGEGQTTARNQARRTDVSLVALTAASRFEPLPIMSNPVAQIGLRKLAFTTGC